LAPAFSGNAKAPDWFGGGAPIWFVSHRVVVDLLFFAYLCTLPMGGRLPAFAATVANRSAIRLVSFELCRLLYSYT
jgi:hypothetical protein